MNETVDQQKSPTSGPWLKQMLASRARVMIGAATLSVSTFTVVDLLRGTVVPDLVFPVHLIQLASLAMGFVLVGPGARRRTTVAILFATIVMQSICMVMFGRILADPYTTPLLLTLFALLGGVLLPWGWKEQAAAAALVAVAGLTNLHFVVGSLEPALSYPALALWVALGISVLVVAILDRHRRDAAAAQFALARSEARFRELVQDVDAAVWEIELPSLNLTFLSRDFAEMLGYPARLLGGKAEAFLTHIHPEDRDGLMEMAGGLLDGKGYEHEYRMVAADGRSLWIHEKARVVFDAEGQPVHVRGISVDTTALRRDQESLARRSLQVETVNAAMTAHLEKKPWTTAVERLLVGAVRATASEFGFAGRSAADGSFHLFAFDQVDARSGEGRRLLKDAVRRLIENGTVVGFPMDRVIVEGPEGDEALGLEREANIRDASPLRTFLASPVVVGGKTIAVMVLGNRPGPYGVEQEADAAALATTAAVIQDAQARDEREAILEKTRAQLVEILDASPYLVSTTDARGRTLYTNPAGRRLLGIGLDEDLSKVSFAHFLSPETAKFFATTMVPAAVRDGIWSGELPVHDREGREIPLAFVFLAHRDEGGRIRFFSTTARDISGDKQAAEQIRALNDELGKRVTERTRQLEEAMREMEAFSYSVSHDLRAPLRRIDGFCALLAEELGESLDESQRTYLQRVRDGAQHMGLLIDAQLNLARVSRATVHRQRVDLSLIVSRLLETLQNAEPDRRVRCIVAPGLLADADLELVTIALDNLVSNAWKYTRRRDDARIEFGRLASDGEGAAPVPTWFLRDNGAGFDMAYAKKLFGSFQRLHNDREFEGTGVGLATVDRIVRRHGGRVWAEAAPGRGATFYFTLDEVPPGA